MVIACAGLDMVKAHVQKFPHEVYTDGSSLSFHVQVANVLYVLITLQKYLTACDVAE